jgi:cation/acetate symporter
LVTLYYMFMTQPWLRKSFNITTPLADAMWWDMQPIAAGVFGVPLGFFLIIVISLITPAPSRAIQELVEHVRYPAIKGSTFKSTAL